jgi:glycolate oxidase
MLLIEVDGQNQSQIEAEYSAVADICLEAGALDVYIGDNPAAERRMWRLRQSLAEAFKLICPVQSLEDIVVPPACIPALMPELEQLSRKYEVLIPCYGHAGDGNLHATVIKRPEMLMEEWQRRLPVLLRELYQIVARMGGTISGEHGIGSKRLEYLPLVMDETLLALHRRIKAAFDPNNILNPGKIFS